MISVKPAKILTLSLLTVTAVSSCVAAPPRTAAPQAAREIKKWTFQDYFDRNWSNELVTYSVDEKTAEDGKLTLIGPDEKARPYQWLREGNDTKIAFLADIPANGSATYRLATGTPQTTSDLQVEENTNEIRLYNNVTGVAIRKNLREGEAPIASIRLASGKWVGNSEHNGTPPLRNYSAQVVERGPVVNEVLCEADFGEGKSWRMRFRATANEPAIVVTESSSAGKGSWWRLRLDNGFSPTHLFRRNPLERNMYAAPLPEKNGTLSILEPWVRWWFPANGAWISFYNETGTDLLTLGMINPAMWVDVQKLQANVPMSRWEVPVMYEDGAIHANFDLTDGMRRWMIVTQDKTESLAMLDDTGKAVGKTPPPHQSVIKHGDYPLDRVKDYVLEWPDTAEHPRLMLSKDDIARLRRNYKVDPARLAALQNYTPPNDEAFSMYLSTGDEKVGRNMVAGVLRILQEQVNAILKQDNKGSLGAWPHGQQEINGALNAADIIWAAFTPEERKRVKAQAALIGYTVNSPDYWSLERGFRANPNMTTMVAGYQAVTGYFLADHPLSSQWIQSGTHEARHQIEDWSDDNGGWLEAPHYAMVSYDHLLGAFLKSRAQDGGELLYHPKMKKVAEFFAQIATPPDVNVGGIRHQPRIGNTWLDEPSGVFGIVAALWKERDPKFASEMQWMYQQQGSWPGNGIGGGFPTFENVSAAFLDPAIPAVKPTYTSTLFPRTGVMLRNGVDDRETQLYMIAGNNHQHYDNDSGSITLWGKGRIVANDFAYGSQMEAQLHSMIDGGGRIGILQVENFRTTPHFDWVRGVSGNWQRQIAFVKDSDMLAPNYFLILDSMKTPTPATWRLWLDGKVNILDPNASGRGIDMQAVQIEGRNDVDTDIALVTNGGVALTAEEKTYTSFGLNANKEAAANRSILLNGLIAPLAAGQDILAVIYPRLKTQKPPSIKILAEGRGYKIDHEAGTDYVFLSSTPFAFNEDEIEFEGSSGLVKIRGGKTFVALGEGTKLTARGQTAK